MSLRLKCLVAAVAAGPVMHLALGSAPAAEYSWSMHSIFPEPRAESQAAIAWAERVAERTDGRLKITVHPGGSLGVKDVDMLRILPPGNVVEAVLLYPGYLSRDAPELAFVLPNEALASQDEFVAVDPLLEELYAEAYARHGIQYLSSVLIPPSKINIFCKEPLETLDDLRSRKLRVWSKSLADIFEKLGVAATVIPQAEMYLALQTGVVDCATYTLDAVNTISLHEVAPHGLEIAAYGGAINIVVSQQAWDGLPDDIQAVLQAEADVAHEETLDDYLDRRTETAEAEKFLAAGGELGSFPEEDKEEYLEAAREVWTQLTDELGGETADYGQQISRRLGW